MTARGRRLTPAARDGRVRAPTVMSARVAGLCYDAANALLRLLVRLLWPRPAPASPRNICVHRLGNIGDTVCTIPALIALRRAYPEARITLLTSSSESGRVGAGTFLSGVWFIDRLLEYDSPAVRGLRGSLSFATRLRGESFDLWLSLPQELIRFRTLLRNLFFVRLCGVRHAAGFELSTLMLFRGAQSAVFQFDDEVERLLGILRRWGVPVPDCAEYDLPIPPDAARSAEATAQANGVRSGADRIGFMPGASYEANRWPLDGFVAAGQRLLAERPGSQIVIFGGPDDRARGEQIRSGIGEHAAVNLAGQTTILETAHLITGLSVLISNNTGLMHIAALAGVPTVAIFSATELNGKWYPHGRRTRLLTHREVAPCGGCYYKPCPHCYGSIRAVTPAEVIGAAEDLMP